MLLAVHIVAPTWPTTIDYSLQHSFSSLLNPSSSTMGLGPASPRCATSFPRMRDIHARVSSLSPLRKSSGALGKYGSKPQRPSPGRAVSAGEALASAPTASRPVLGSLTRNGYGFFKAVGHFLPSTFTLFIVGSPSFPAPYILSLNAQNCTV
ncbi:hypothetical protein L7F22_024800 [Adiantum nelumboides]|nr:hypothetical protein [Adiantum nelumboides]